MTMDRDTTSRKTSGQKINAALTSRRSFLAVGGVALSALTMGLSACAQ
jgi:hypothetical protein